MPRFQVYSFAFALTGIDHLPVRPNREKDIPSLVEITRKMVKKQVKGDAWVVWAVAQRKNLPIKIKTCIE